MNRFGVARRERTGEGVTVRGDAGQPGAAGAAQTAAAAEGVANVAEAAQAREGCGSRDAGTERTTGQARKQGAVAAAESVGALLRTRGGVRGVRGGAVGGVLVPRGGVCDYLVVRGSQMGESGWSLRLVP